MVKLERKAKVEGIWWYLETGFNESFQAGLKQLPGVNYIGKGVGWRAPIDLVPQVLALGKEHKVKLVPPPAPLQPAIVRVQGDRLYSFQRHTVQRALEDGSLLIAHEMGLGKTVTACHIMAAEEKQTLIVCPGTVRLQWLDELVRWGVADASSVCVIRSGKDWTELDWRGYGIVITSYDLLKKMPLADVSFGRVIWDEGHRIKNAKAQVGRYAQELRSALPRADMLALTGTPIANQPIDLWNQLHVLWPRRFGAYWSFANRYCLVEYNGYGHDIGGCTLDDELVAELNGRLAHVASRVTRAEVADQLPPLNVTLIRIPFDRTRLLKQVDERWDDVGAQLHKLVIEMALMKAGQAKYDTVVAHLEDAFESYKSIVVLTYTKDLAKRLVKEVKTRAGTLITGEIPSIKRNAVIKKAGLEAKPFLVCTMDSVAEGIDSLTFADLVIFAELTYKPLVLTQVLGRFSRLSSKKSVDVHVLALESTADERVALSIVAKLKTAGRVMQAGHAGAKLEAALSVQESEEDFLAHLRDMVNGEAEDASY